MMAALSILMPGTLNRRFGVYSMTSSVSALNSFTIDSAVLIPTPGNVLDARKRVIPFRVEGVSSS